MITHELLVRCDDDFEGTVNELIKHLKIKDSRNIQRDIKKGKIKNHKIKIIGMYHYKVVYKVVDLNNNLIMKGTCEEIANKMYCDKNSVRQSANKQGIFLSEYRIKKLYTKAELERYDYGRKQ